MGVEAEITELKPGQKVELICSKGDSTIRLQTKVVMTVGKNSLITERIRVEDGRIVAFNSASVRYDLCSLFKGETLRWENVIVRLVSVQRDLRLQIIARDIVAQGNRRRAYRVSVGCEGTLYGLNEPMPIWVKDISSSGIGFRLKRTQIVDPESKLRVSYYDESYVDQTGSHGDVNVSCEIVRNAGNYLGCVITHREPQLTSYLQKKQMIESSKLRQQA